MNNNEFEKPFLGVKPRWLCDEHRLEELARAVAHNASFKSDKEKLIILDEWVNEMHEILSRYIR